MHNPDNVLRLLDRAKRRRALPEQKEVARQMLDSLAKHASSLPLVNADNGETAIVRSSPGTPAYLKPNAISVESNGVWKRDYELFERKLRAELYDLELQRRGQVERQHAKTQRWKWSDRIIKRLLRLFLRSL